MDIYLSHTSALSYWRITRLSGDVKDLPSRGGIPDMTEVSARELKLLCEESQTLGAIPRPLDLLVADKDERRANGYATAHVWRCPSCRGAFIGMEENVFVASPELCFLQMATICSLEELIVIGFELLGTYALDTSEQTETNEQRDANGQKGFHDRPVPLTNLHQLSAFIASCDGFPGVVKARQALGYLLEGSASPMETAFAILLCLPPRLGGYGIEPPILNGRVDVNRNAIKAASKTFYRCDMLWPSIRLVVEYDSDDYHTGSDAIAMDAKKRNALLTMGYRVITVTTLQITDSSALDKAVIPIAKALGKRLRKLSDKQLEKRIALRSVLLPFTKVSSYTEALFEAADREAGTPPDASTTCSGRRRGGHAATK